METSKIIKAESKEELQYLMRFYHIEKIPIKYKSNWVGYVTDEMKYIRGLASYMTHDSYAINLAIEQIGNYIKAIEQFRSKEEVDKVVVRCCDYKPQKETTEHGTLDKIFEGIESSNNHLRYCNGSYYEFKEKSDKELYNLWRQYIPESRSFDLYYGSGIVD